MGVQCPTCGSVGSERDVWCPCCGVDLLSQPVALVAREETQPTRGPFARVGVRRSRCVAFVVVVVVGAVTQWVVGPRIHPSRAGPTPPALASRLRAFPDLAHVWLLGTAAPARPVDPPPRQPLLADIASGRVRLAFGVPDARQDAVVVRGADLVVPAVVGTLVVERPASARPLVRRVAPPFSELFLGEAPESFWGVTECAITTGGGPRVACRAGVTEVGTDGRVRTERLLPSGWKVVGGGLDGDLLLLGAGGAGDSRYALWDGHAGRFRAEVAPPPGTGAEPAVLAVAGHHAVWRGSGCSTTCPVVLADLHNGDQRVLGGSGTFDSGTVPAARFSPDGRYIALQVGRRVEGRASPVPAITVFDVQTAEAVWAYESTTSAADTRKRARRPGIVRSLTWDPSGRWLFFTVDRRLFARRIGAHDNVALGSFAPAAAFVAR